MIGPSPGGGMGRAPGMGGMGMPSELDAQTLAQMTQVGGKKSGGASSGTAGTSGSGSSTSGGLNPAQLQQLAQQQAGAAGGTGGLPHQPREVGTIGEELKRIGGDIFQGLKDILSFNTWLGINSQQLSPEEQSRQQQMHQRYQRLTSEQQQVAQKLYQEKMQRRKAEEEAKQRKAQQEQARRAQSVEMPSSPKKGPVGPSGSKKQRAVTKLQQDRKTLSGPSSAN